MKSLPALRGKIDRSLAYSLWPKIAIISSVSSLNLLWLLPVLALPTAPNITIDNQATGTFTDADDTSLGQQSVVSNTVSLITAEVAGITITPVATPSVVTGAVANFEFKIQNVGNDPTKFFLPQNATVTGGTQGILKVVAYVNATGTQVNLASPIDITTSTNTGGLSDPTLGNNTTIGSIPAGAAIVVRVPVTVTATTGTVVVTLGNTTGQPIDSNTPYLAGANGAGTGTNDKDVYTFDNADNSIANEATNPPINGDPTGRRQEASAVITATVASGVTIAGTVWQDTDGNQIQDNGELGTEASSSNLTVYAVGSDGKVIAKSDVAADGTYSLSVPQNTTGMNLRLIDDSTIAINATAPLYPSLPNGWGNTGQNKNGVTQSGFLGEMPLDVTTTNVTGQNFGVDIFPVAKPPGTVGSAAMCTTGVTLNAKVFLGGAYVNAAGLMRDNLRAQNKLPIAEPYLGLGFSHGPGGGGETTNATVLATTGNDAIVDWVFLELRNTVNQVVATRSALVQRDGDIVSADGTSGVKFDAPAGDYYVVVKHRNHLGVMTNAKVTFGATAATVDFTSSSLTAYSSDPAFAGTERQVLNGAIVGLWPGDANQDNQVKYTGIDRESWATKGKVYADPGNTGKNASYISQGYHITDQDLSGSTIYQGAGSDTDVPFFPLLTHPKNTAFAPNFVIPGLLPAATIVSPSSLCTTVAPVTIAGTVWKDTDGTSIQDNGELGTEATSGNLTVYAVGSDGKVIAKSDVAADGTYSLSVPPNTTGVKLRLIDDSTIGIGAVAPLTPSLPNGWSSTGDNQNGVVDSGVLGEITLDVTTTNVPGQNFGVDIFPIAKPPGTAGSAAMCTTGVTLNAKVFLGGAYVTATGLMRDNLRVQNKLPIAEPYLGLGFSHGPGGGGETTNATVLATTGNDAIVDWVFLELRNTVNQVVATRSALVQRDGDIVSADGTSGVKFDAPAGDYYVVVKHRNHLGVMTNAKVTFGATAATVDFTSSSLAIYSSDASFAGTERRVLSGAILGLWNGDANQDNQVKYTGIDRDIWAIKGKVYADPGNTGKNANYISQGYHITDVDLSGSTIYQGGGSDTSAVFFPVLSHPKNPAAATDFIIPGLLPPATTISPSSLCTTTKAKLILVKRITAIKDGSTLAVTNYAGSVPDTNAIDLANYNHCNWPTATGTVGACTNTYLAGATTATVPKVKPGDEIEYTIYYLNGGSNKAAPAKVCDRLNPNLTFQTQSGSGIGWSKGGATMLSLTNVGTDTDKGQLTDATVSNCNLPSNGGNEVVVVDVGDVSNPLMGSTGAGLPTTSYGYIRFKALVK